MVTRLCGLVSDRGGLKATYKNSLALLQSYLLTPEAKSSHPCFGACREETQEITI